MSNSPTRRTFLRGAPLALAAAALPCPGLQTESKSGPPAPFRLVPASELEQHAAMLKVHPGSFNVFDGTALPVTAVLTVEEKHSAKEFEWHDGRDHLLQIVDGTTVYELGGTPQSAHSPKPGEWLAPSCSGATTMTLHKGDWLVIPRGTPHKRITVESVTFVLISTTGALAPVTV